ncbi:signal peptidase II [Agrilactobacillus yilanensis]|uniref:Lipoprotein signal peptidase n=1 Tax=Agrilactobacillus yilanensis TaxID=2485997 RepID=A0ABW4JAJ5_9LACO|nr:signal peptidase II [Agrilactobacillus yilanensis]
MLVLWLAIAGVAVLLDQLVKHWIVANLVVGQTQALMPKLMDLLYVRNYGAAWSILQGKTWFFYIVTTIATIVILYLLIRKKEVHPLFKISLSLLLGGALGNLIDRIHLGYVVDMFQLKFINFPIFNVADTFVTIGVILLFIDLIFLDKESI